MTAGSAVLVPLAGAVALAWLQAPWERWLNLAVAVVTLGLTAALGWMEAAPLPLLAAPVVALVGVAAAWDGLFTPAERFHAALGQAQIGCLLLALLSPGLSWVGVEVAAIAAIGLAGRDARWPMSLLCGTGLTLALAGTGLQGQATPGVAFALLLAGYGTVAVLPLVGAWLGHATPAGGILCGAFPLVALSVLLRLHGPEGLLMGFGLGTLLLAAMALPRQREAQGFVAVAGLGTAGLAAVAFGLGGEKAASAGLLLLAGQALVQAAFLLAMAPLRVSARAQRLTAAACLLAMGAPPFASFMAGVSILLAAVERAPFVALAACCGVAALAWTVGARLQALWPATVAAPGPLAPLAGAWGLLLAVLVAGLAVPDAAATLLAAAAR